MKKKIINIIVESLKELNAIFEDSELNQPTINTRLFGAQGRLDSLGLVTLISNVESKISDEFNKEIIIASEKAMSKKSSPFRSVQSLANHVEGALKEEKQWEK
jgi:acyl carrier protein